MWKRFGFASCGLLLSAQALAYSGTGWRPNYVPRLPVDYLHSRQAASDDGNKMWIDTSYSNAKSHVNLFCDIHMQVSGSRFGQQVTLYSVISRLSIFSGTSVRLTSWFDTSELGSGYRFDKNSQVVKMSCLKIEPNEPTDHIPDPHSLCDPEFEECDWTCPADAQDPKRCASRA